VAKRKSVRAMLERLAPEALSTPDNALHTRQDLFGGHSSRVEEGFQQRLLVRLCKKGLLDSLVARPLRTRFYVVRDSSMVLDALTDDEALTRLIWQRPDAKDLAPETQSESEPESEPNSALVVNGGVSTEALAALASDSDEGLQATTLKLLAGMVDSLYYLRVKIEGIEKSLNQRFKGPNDD
jgi:hypothetical protein